MKKLLGVALMLALCASSAFAFNSPLRTQGLRFGTWGVNGFEFVADTTFLNGAGVNTAALSNTDTTDAFNLTNVDWGINTIAPRTAINVMRVWVTGSFISCDSIKINPSQSYDKQTWFTPTSSGLACGLQTQGSQSVFSAPFTLQAPSVGFIASAPSTSGGLVAAPFVRFIITADGNTAARMAGTKVYVTYGDVRDNPVEQPKMVCEQLSFGTHFPSGFVAAKDTASIRFSAPDTTEAINLSDWSFGPSGQNPTVADSTSAFATLSGVYSDPSTNDSVYVQQEVSADGNHWTTIPLAANASLYGSYSGTVTSVIPTDLATGGTFGGFVLNVGQSHPTLGNRTNALNFTPFARYIIRGGGAGAVMGSGKYWITYWRIPRK